MSASDLTKAAIIRTTKSLMAGQPIDAIQLSTIAKACGISRNTLYYHFKDKYEIVETIFSDELLPVISPCLTKERWAESLVLLTDHMKSEQDFYTNALKSHGPNTMLHQLTFLYKDQFLSIISNSPCRGLPMESQEIVARFYSHAVIGMLCDWAEFGMKQDVRKAIRLISAAIESQVFHTEKPF